MTKLKKHSKRGLALFVALLMCLGMLNLTAFADEGSEPGEMAEESVVAVTEDNTDTSEDVIIDNEDSDTENASDAEDGSDVEDENVTDVENGDSEDTAGVEDSDSEDVDDAEDADSEDAAGVEDADSEDTADVEDSDSEDIADIEDAGVEDDVDVEDGSAEGSVGEPIEADVPSAQVQAFLDAVAALPEATTEENFEEVSALMEACQDAYDALSAEDLEREDVVSAMEKMASLMEAAALLNEDTGVAKVGDESYEILQLAIRDAGSDPVVLLQDVTESVLLPAPTTGTFVLDLNGHTLTGDGKSTISIMGLRSAGNVTIQNGTIVGAEGYRAIQASNVNLTLDGVTMTPSGSLANEGLQSSSFGGGCVYIDKGTLTVTNCTFSGDAGKYKESASYMGAGKFIERDAYGSHLFIGAGVTEATITNSTFTDSKSQYGAVYAAGNALEVSDSTFSGNGNGLQLNGTGTFNLSKVTFTESNKAVNVSGKANVTLNDCAVISNPGDSSSNGLLNLGSANVTIKNCKINNNTTGGKVIYSSSGTLTVEETEFADNAVNSVVNTSSSDVTFKNVTATGNTSSLYMNCGGGVFCISASGKTVTLENVTATGNEATKGDGGVAYITGTSTSTVVNITDCTFTDNTAKLTGGALYLSNTGSTTITNTEISGNTANSTGKIGGGGIYVASTSGTVTLAGTTRVYNNETPNATVKHLTTGETADIALNSNYSSKTPFTSEDAVLRATLVLNNETSFDLDGTKYTLTKSEAAGLHYSSGTGSSLKYYWPVGYYTEKVEPAQVYLNAPADSHTGEMDIHVTTLAEAVAQAEENGAKQIYVCGNVTVDMASAASLNSGITFVRCADHPDGHMFTINGTVTLDNAHIDGMNVPSDSSLIYVPSGAHLTIAGDTVIENGKNAAEKGKGGAIYVSQGQLTMNGGTITNNSAREGGGIYAMGGKLVSFEGGTVSKNVATGGNGGGGAYIEATSSEFGVYGGRTLFDGNSANQLGGGVFLVNGTNANTHHYIYKATFTNNSSYRFMQYFDGGAIYIQSGTTAHMKNVYVSGNKDGDPALANNGYTAVAVCPTGELAVYELEGLLAINNGKNPDIGVIAAGDMPKTAPKVYLASHAPGGGEVSYTFKDGTVVDTSNYQFIEGYFRLYTSVNDQKVIDDALTTAENNGVIITGNYASQYGSGIMTNGILKIGTETQSLKVVKVWDDAENHDNDQILVYLTQDGKIVPQGYRSDSFVILNKDNNWSYTWTNLGDEFTWGVKEASVGGYASEVKVEKDTEFGAIADKYYIATITNTPSADTHKLVITKTAYGLDPDASYKFTLKLDNVGDSVFAIQLDGTLYPIYNNEITFYLKDGQSAVVDGLPEGFTYEVTEEAGGYNTYVFDSVTGLDSTITSVNVVNVSKVDITVEKKWEDEDNAINKRPASITIDLMNGEDVVETVTVTPDENGKWSHTFKDLPEYDAEGSKIAYTIKEHDVPGYDSSVHDWVITNTIRRGGLTINKAVVGGPESAKSEKEYKFIVTGPNDYREEITITGEGSMTISGLLPGVYTVTEDEEGAEIDGYSLSVAVDRGEVEVVGGETAEVTFTNTYTPPRTLEIRPPAPPA